MKFMINDLLYRRVWTVYDYRWTVYDYCVNCSSTQTEVVTGDPLLQLDKTL